MDNIYAELGVRTLINGRGVATFYSGTLMPPEVKQAMERASEHYIEIVALQKAVGARLAHYAGTEAGMVCSGSAACIAQATAGCVAGTDPDKISRLPDTDGMKNEVIITQRSVWDRSIALAGAKLVVVESRQELQRHQHQHGDDGDGIWRRTDRQRERRHCRLQVAGRAFPAGRRGGMPAV